MVTICQCRSDNIVANYESTGGRCQGEWNDRVLLELKIQVEYFYFVLHEVILMLANH